VEWPLENVAQFNLNTDERTHVRLTNIIPSDCLFPLFTSPSKFTEFVLKTLMAVLRASVFFDSLIFYQMNMNPFLCMFL